MKNCIKYLIIVCAFFVSLPLQGQIRENGILKRIQAKKVEFINEKLELTPQEKEQFWPVYNDYTARRNLINQQRNSLMLYFQQNENNIDAKEVTNTLNKLLDYQHQETSLMDQYVQKFREILPEAKVVKIFITEVQFRRWLLTQGVQARPEEK